MRNNSVKYHFEFGPVVQDGMTLKEISYLELWQPLCSALRYHLCSFCRRHHEEQFCEIILNLDQWLRRFRLKMFPIWSSGGPFVQHLCNFGKGYFEENSETIL